jgi:uncharacterized phage protein gp47/JayE
MTVKSLFESLVRPKTRDEVLADYIQTLQSVGFPAMSWHPTSVPIRLLTAMAATHAAFSTQLSEVTKGGLLDLAEDKWLTLLAASIYKVDRYQATTAKIHCSIADLASAGPFNITAYQLRFATASGKIFTNDEAFTIELDSAVDFVAIADASGSTFNIAQDELITLLTPLPGTGYAVHTEVRTTGASPPNVSITGTPAAAYEFIVEITLSGALGAGQFRWSSDGGLNYTTGVTLPGAGAYLFSGTGVTITFDAASYLTSHTYRWSSGHNSFNPRSDSVASIGTDEETDLLLRQRCSDRWSTLGYGSNDDWYRYYCRNVPVYGANVTRVAVQTNSIGSCEVTVTIAGQSGAVDGITLAAVDSYMQAIKPNVVTLTLQNATEVVIAPLGEAYVYADYEETVLGQMEDELGAYFGRFGIGGGTVFQSQIVDALQYDEEQVRNVNLTYPSSDLTLLFGEVPVRGSLSGLVITSV